MRFEERVSTGMKIVVGITGYVIVVSVTLLCGLFVIEKFDAPVVFLLILCVVAGGSVLRMLKLPLKTEIALHFVCLILSGFLMFALFLWGTGDRWTEDSRTYGRCVDRLKTLERAEKEYYSAYGSYTDNIQELSDKILMDKTKFPNLRIECDAPGSTDCADKVGAYISQYCEDYEIEIEATSSIRIYGRAKDKYKCFICPDLDPKYDSHNDWVCPTPSPEFCAW